MVGWSGAVLHLESGMDAAGSDATLRENGLASESLACLRRLGHGGGVMVLTLEVVAHLIVFLDREDDVSGLDPLPLVGPADLTIDGDV